MTIPDFPLTRDTLAVLLEATRIDNPRMTDALHAVLVQGARPSHAAQTFGIKRQQIETRVAHVKSLKSAFDRYAVLVYAQQHSSNHPD